MQLFILGVLFVLAKSNLQFLDTGILYYASNTIGYIFMYIGLRSLGRDLAGVKRIQNFILFMVIHSVGFTLLNATGHSIKTIALTTGGATILALSLAIIAVVGMLMIFYILLQLILAMRNDDNYLSVYSCIIRLQKLSSLLILLLVVTGILFFVLPAVSNVAMLILLISEFIFITSFSAKIITA